MPILLLLLACGTDSRVASSPEDEENRPPSVATAPAAASQTLATGDELGPGFVVWESNRTDAWRIWIRELGSAEPRQLSPDEGRRIHCCPHIAPDGRTIVYLSLPPDQKLYPKGGAVGRMDRIDPDGSAQRTVLASARTYYENRAAVWKSPTELHYIEGDGRSAVLDLETGTTRSLTEASFDGKPWLIDRQLAWAASGLGGFGAFDRRTGRIALRNELPGCQPYFSHDGRWVFWVQAPGGPIAFSDLSSGANGTLLKKSDPRLPSDRGYLYFPMLSADGRFLAVGASPDLFDHFESDYDILMLETDPETLEIVGAPIRITEHPATDRYPDVWVAPLPLGRHQGEAPFRVSLEAPDASHDWRWELGDGATWRGASVEHLYSEPGSYEVRASGGERSLRGRVVVDAAGPPAAVRVALREGGRRIIVGFDEPIEVGGLEARLDSGIEIVDSELDPQRRRLELALARNLDRPDRLHLAGVRDLAQNPNTMPPIALTVDAATWPSRTDGLLLLFQTANAPNLVYDEELGGDTAAQLEARGRARFDHRFSLLPSGGSFVAGERDASRVVEGGKATYELSIELTIEPYAAPGREQRVLVASGPTRRLNFSLEQRGRRLVFTTRSRRSKQDPVASVDLVTLPADRPSHVVVTYRPGQLVAYLDGAPQVSEDSLQKGFHHWRPAPLTIGAGNDGNRPWWGRLEGLAIYSRVLDPEEVAENYRRYQKIVQQRAPIDTWEVQARQLRCSPVPSLSEIQPYREALSVCLYEITDRRQGPAIDGRIRVAHWSVLDGRSQELASGGSPGTSVELQLSRFSDNLQLESVFLSDTLSETADLDLFYASQR